MTVGNVERQQGKRRKNRGERRRGSRQKGRRKGRGRKKKGAFNTNFYIIESVWFLFHEVVQFTLLLVSPGFSSQASCSTSFLNVPATTT